MHQVQQRPQRPLRAALVGPHDDLGCEDIDPRSFRKPRRGHPVHAPDDDDVDIVLPLAGSHQGGRLGSARPPQQYRANPSCTTSSSNRSTTGGTSTSLPERNCVGRSDITRRPPFHPISAELTVPRTRRT